MATSKHLLLPSLGLLLALGQPALAADTAAQIEESLLNSNTAAGVISSLPVMSGSEYNAATEQFLIVQYGAANQASIDAPANGARAMIYQAGYGNQASIIQR
ncbi:hypothetical protein SAMN04488038_10481 [Solimonas aquatica]|uniref:Curlin associated repeat-containing protein n=1 Tax=Solimonas aquatica TaxID=489703 RepID=A0A1H9DL16_9GAMM|nr:hypothetical protein [Solimonas aquatica]SEQ14192.1 hypothetical protein SAMN04488038_10481 [Solimonas aquatica]